MSRIYDQIHYSAGRQRLVLNCLQPYEVLEDGSF